jgi:hypothetical protein
MASTNTGQVTLLKTSLKKLFGIRLPRGDTDPHTLENLKTTLQQKQWHIATNDPLRESVFSNLLTCFLPKELIGDKKFLDWFPKEDASGRVKYYPSFSDWLKRKPHLEPLHC